MSVADLASRDAELIALGIGQGERVRSRKRRGRPRPVNDTWIAACCLVEGLPLATFNTKDFAS
jgi:predicted nucleic acid-binding protein